MVAAFWAGWHMHSVHSAAQILELEKAQALRAAQHIAQMREMERGFHEKMQQTEEETQRRITQLRRTAGNTTAAANGLREQLRHMRAELLRSANAANTCAGATATGDTTAELLGQCTARYTELAANADRHVIDLLACRNSWPIKPAE